MRLRSGKIITKVDKDSILSPKALIEFHNEIMKGNINKKVGNKPTKCIRQIILESLKKGINIKFE